MTDFDPTIVATTKILLDTVGSDASKRLFFHLDTALAFNRYKGECPKTRPDVAQSMGKDRRTLDSALRCPTAQTVLSLARQLGKPPARILSEPKE